MICPECVYWSNKKEVKKYLVFFFKLFAILLNRAFTVNSPYLNYLAWPAQAYKSHNTASDLTFCEVFSEQRIVVT